jgi:hypothetical protein
MALAFLAWAIFLARLVVTVLAQPPAQGIQLGSPESDGDDFRFPLAVSQCEPVFIWYNRTTRNTNMYFITPDFNGSDGMFLQIPAPFGTGYIEWICNIPAGYAFMVGYWYRHYIVVGPSTLSFCLHNVTATYEYALYIMTSFRSYTSHPPNTTRPSIFWGFLAKYVYFCLYSSPKLTIP